MHDNASAVTHRLTHMVGYGADVHRDEAHCRGRRLTHPTHCGSPFYAKNGCGGPAVARCSMCVTAVCNSASENRRPKSLVSTSRNSSRPLSMRRSTSPQGYRTLKRELNSVSRVRFGPGRAAIMLLRYGLCGWLAVNQ